MVGGAVVVEVGAVVVEVGGWVVVLAGGVVAGGVDAGGCGDGGGVGVAARGAGGGAGAGGAASTFPRMRKIATTAATMKAMVAPAASSAHPEPWLLVTASSMPPVARKVVGSVRPCSTIAAQMVPVTRIERYMHMPKQKV